jgi:molybdopterin molybdotransferase
MAIRKTKPQPVTGEAAPPPPPPPSLPPAPAGKGLRDFWQHWDYVLSMVPELAEFGVPVLDAVGLTLNESILAERDVGPIAAGQELIPKGTQVIPRMLGLLTGMGILKVMARPRPRVLVMALSAQAISASYVVAGQVQEAGAEAHRMEYIFADPDRTLSTIMEQLVRADLVVTVGGLGEAGLDLRQVADQLGPHDFTPVAITPGRDHGFALAEEKTPLVALPPEVYPSFVLTKLLVEPMIAKQMGAGVDPVMRSANLDQPLRVEPRVLTCVPAIVNDARMQVSGRPTGLRGLDMIYRANALALLTAEDGFVDANHEAFYLWLK